MTEPLLELTGVSKSFGPVTALSRIDLTIGAAEAVGLIGDNGAGKSTLVKILSGADRPDEGQILVAGKPVAFNSPNDAQAHGIATVYQDLALVPLLSVARNRAVDRSFWAGRRPCATLPAGPPGSRPQSRSKSPIISADGQAVFDDEDLLSVPHPGVT